VTAGGRRPARTVKLPPASDVDPADVDAFLEAIGWDEAARKRVTSIRINGRRVEVDVTPRPDVKVTVRHPIVWPED
jgi:hypothetical protein